MFFGFIGLPMVAWIIGIALMITERNRKKKFEMFLKAHADEFLRGGSAVFNDCEYTAETKITVQHYCISFLVLTVFQSTCPYPAEGSLSIVILANFVSLFGGWWGFPWGPIRTVQSFYKNITYKTVTIGDMLFIPEMSE